MALHVSGCVDQAKKCFDFRYDMFQDNISFSDTGGKLPPVSTTPAANLPPVLLTPVANNEINIRLRIP
jgi:hypothetical protein